MKNLALLLLFLLPQIANAQDSDGDGVTDALEATLGTDPNDVDSDKDGLGDGYEVTMGSDPLSRDSDGGGDWDSVELTNGRNPNDPNDDINLLAGIGPVVQFVQRNSPVNSFVAAEITLLSPASVFRGFGWNYPIDFLSINSEFWGGTNLDLVWGQDNVPSFVVAFSGWIHIPTVLADNKYTFATSCNEGCRFRIWDGSKTDEIRHEGSPFHNHTKKVTFPDGGGLFPFELIYYNDSQAPSLELSWTPGHVSDFDANIFSLIPADSIITPTLVGSHEVHDLNGGTVEIGDVLEVIIRLKNTSTVSAFSVAMTALNSTLTNHIFTLTPPGSSTFGRLITVPIVDPGQTQEIRYTAVVPNNAPSTFTISIGFGGSITSQPNRPGSNRMRRLTDDNYVNDGVENGNEPVGLFPNGGLNEDDPTTITLGSAIIVNECNRSPCDSNAICTDLAAGFICTCNNGWAGDGLTCVNINECTDGSNNCSPNATCTDFDGGFNCECTDGFVGDGIACNDIDECDDNLDNCATEAICNNIPGGFDCVCRNGFVGDGIACQDLDECSEGSDNCANTARCTNTPGGFDCTCPEETTGDGTQCRVNNCSCSNTQICVDDLCYDSCSLDTDCTGEDLCFDARCVNDPCLGIMCAEGSQCRGGTCFEQCVGDIDCSNPAHACFDELCTLSPCDGIICGTSQVCFGGACFNACVENGDCQTGEACYDGRCAIEPCRRVTCGAGDTCFGGACFDTCFEDSDCQNGDLCYEGRCTADPCLKVSCPSQQVCYGGSCFDSCSSDVDCSNPKDLCYDFRCASDPCEGVQCPSSQSCVEGFCRTSCSPTSPCRIGLDCEQGLCVPTPVAVGCGCSSSPSLPSSIFWFVVLTLVGVGSRRRKGGKNQI